MLSLEIDITIEDPGWDRLTDDVSSVCHRAAEKAIATNPRVSESPRRLRTAELSILLTDDARSRDLNRDYRGIDKPTNVLSFPLDGFMDQGIEADAPMLLGDIVLASGVCAHEAAAQGKPLADHLSHLVVHGVLHLLGYDHEEDADAEVMEALEVRILAGLGVPDPYANNDNNGVEEAPTLQ